MFTLYLSISECTYSIQYSRYREREKVRLAFFHIFYLTNFFFILNHKLSLFFIVPTKTLLEKIESKNNFSVPMANLFHFEINNQKGEKLKSFSSIMSQSLSITQKLNVQYDHKKQKQLKTRATIFYCFFIVSCVIISIYNN